MTSHLTLKPFITLSLILFLVSCGLKNDNHYKNIILITLDTQRADYISSYHQGKASTPAIDSFASEGILFQKAYSPIPITAPAHAAIFYSLPPHILELYNNGQIFRQKEEWISLASIFKEKGYATSAFVSLGVLKSRFKLNHGFKDYFDGFPPERWYLNADEINRRVFQWIEKNKGQKMFLWIHYSDPHDPYAPPDIPPDLKIYPPGSSPVLFSLQKKEKISFSFKAKKGENLILLEIINSHPEEESLFRINKLFLSQEENFQIIVEDMEAVERQEEVIWLGWDKGTIKLINNGLEKEVTMLIEAEIFLTDEELRTFYRREVEYMDSKIGELRSWLKDNNMVSESLFILVGDHGEGLGETTTRFGDRYFGHIHFLYDVYMKIPFIISSPLLQEKGARKNELASLLDVAPTVCGIMKWKKSSFYKGRDLLQSKSKKNDFIFQETYRPEAVQNKYAGLLYPWHFIISPEEKSMELYNLKLDPQERNNLFPPEKANKELRDLIKRVQSKTIEILEEKKEIHLDPKSLEMLKSLGYIH